MKKCLVEQLNLAPTGINERLMTLRIPLKRSKYLTLISVYARTLTSDDETKDSFYDDLHRTIRSVPKNDKLVVLGDFNARVGRDHLLWDGLIDKHGHGNCNANGCLLLGLCTERDLTVTNTLFRLPLRQKTTWRHPRSKHWHALDYVLTRKRDIKDVCITCSMPGADDCWTDHCLLLSRLRMNIRVPPRHPASSRPQRRFDYHKLKDPMWISCFQEVATAHLATYPPSNVNENWSSLRDALTTAAVETIGFSKRKKQDWFAENEATITSIIEAKRKARLDMESNTTRGNMLKVCKASRTCQKVLREIQNAWWRRKAEEIQAYSDQRDMRCFYAATKEIYGPTRSSVNYLKDVDGTTVLSEPDRILERWKNHFETLFNNHSTTPADLLRNSPQAPTQHWRSEPPTLDELTKAMKRMKPGKAPGPDNVPFELLNSAGPAVKSRLMELLTQIWNSDFFPTGFKNANIIAIFKKGDRMSCGNYRRISLFYIAGKVFARILLDRLRGTIDMIFCARQLQEKSREQQKSLMQISGYEEGLR